MALAAGAAADDSVPLFIDTDALLCRSDLSAARNSWRGKWRSSRTIAKSGPRSRCGAGSGRGCSDTSIACTTSSTCSASVRRLGRRLGMGTSHLRAKALERAQLQLLDGPFAFAQPLGDFAGASLVHEALVNNAALRFRKLPDKPEQARAMFDGANVEMHGRIGRIVRQGMFARPALRAINDGVCRDSQQPCCERRSAPLIVLQIGERFVKHFGGQVFGGCAVRHAASNEAVDALEMQFVERSELCRVGLCRFDKQTLLRPSSSARLVRRSASGQSLFPSGASGGLHGSGIITAGGKKGYAAIPSVDRPRKHENRAPCQSEPGFPFAVGFI